MVAILVADPNHVDARSWLREHSEHRWFNGGSDPESSLPADAGDMGDLAGMFLVAMPTANRSAAVR
jgi:hypothetical protein